MNLPRDDSVLLYDGLCGFCDGTVQFLLARDTRRQSLKFAPLQGEFAQSLFQRQPELRAIDALMLVQPALGNAPEIVTMRSDVVVQLSQYLGGVWSVGTLLRFIPRAIRDWSYDRFARIRYRVFGRRDTCRLPTPEQRQRFLP